MLDHDPSAAGGVSIAVEALPRNRSRLRFILLGLATAVLLLVGSGVVYVLVRNHNQPGVAATQFCQTLATQNYDGAYGMLTTKFQATYTSAQFKADMQQLDAAEGIVTECALASGANSYQYGIGGDHASITVTTTRVHRGTLQGALHLIDQKGWKVDAMDASLLGLDLGSLPTINAYCAAVQSQDYDTLYTLLSTKLRAAYTGAHFKADMQQLNTAEGKVTGCQLASGSGNDFAAVAVGTTRAQQGKLQGALHVVEQGDWHVNGFDASLLGVNFDALQTMDAYCAALQSQDYNTLYSLLSSQLQATYNINQFRLAMQALDNVEGIATDCHLAHSSVDDYTALAVVITRAHRGALQGALQLVQQNQWKVDTIDSSLLGFNLAALQTIGAYCTAVESQNGDTLYALLAPNLKAQQQQSFYEGLAYAQMDYGKVTSCTMENIATGNTDTSVTVTMAIAWSRRGPFSGQLTVDDSSGAWAVSQIDEALEGPDRLPVATTLELCSFVTANDFTSAYSITTSGFQHRTTQAQLAQMFAVPAGGGWQGCSLDLMGSYSFTGTSAYLPVTYYYHDGQGTLGLAKILTVTLLREGGFWKIDTVDLRQAAQS